MLLALLLMAVLADRRLRLRTRPCFWIAVVLARAIATNLADLVGHDLHLSQPGLIVGLSLLLIGVARITDRAVAGAGFWSSLFLAGTLGTVLGDDVSDRVGLVVASLVLGALVALLLMLGNQRYWSKVLAIRTAGTSIGDLLAHTLGLSSSTASTAMLLFGITRFRAVSGRPGSRSRHDVRATVRPDRR